VLWHNEINKSLFDPLATAFKFETKEGINDGDDEDCNVSLIDCLREFKKPELLDEDNKWYCNKCKDHVQATKTLEIYKVPPVMIVSLKRFRTGRSRFGGGQKIQTLVDFPLEGLDLGSLVIS